MRDWTPTTSMFWAIVVIGGGAFLLGRYEFPQLPPEPPAPPRRPGWTVDTMAELHRPDFYPDADGYSVRPLPSGFAVSRNGTEGAFYLVAHDSVVSVKHDE